MDHTSTAPDPPGVRRRRGPSAWARGVRRGLVGLARRRPRAVVAVGLFAFLVNAALSLLGGIPAPHVHDEFSYLLAADTFRHGRLSNPTHPLWVHFESMHVLQRPAYASKFPPGQGALLAAGWWLGGDFIVGSWLGAALACAATCWMLMAWVRPGRAVLGGLLAALHPTVLDWGQGYWGGSLALLGGSLLLGGWRRAVVRPGRRAALAMGVGMAVLAASRPYEGAALSALSLAALAALRARRHDPAPLAALATLAPPLLGPLALAGGALAFYNARVSGDALRLPYLVYEEQYSRAPLFLFRPLPTATVHFNNPEMERFNRFMTDAFARQKAAPPAAMLARSVALVAGSYFPLIAALEVGPDGGPKEALRYLPLIVIQLPLFLAPGVAFGRPARAALLLLGGFTAALLPATWKFPHYAAPAYGLMLVLTLRSLHRLRRWRPGGRPAGRRIAAAALAAYAAWPALLFVAWPLVKSQPDFGKARARLIAGLRSDGARHLVVVRYGPRHNPHVEWVYNEADIDAAPVVWARELGPDRDRELLAYFGDRRAWLLEADAPEWVLVPYPGPGGRRDKTRSPSG